MKGSARSVTGTTEASVWARWRCIQLSPVHVPVLLLDSSRRTAAALLQEAVALGEAEDAEHDDRAAEQLGRQRHFAEPHEGDEQGDGRDEVEQGGGGSDRESGYGVAPEHEAQC